MILMQPQTSPPRTIMLIADVLLPALLLATALICDSLSLIGLSIAGTTVAIREVLLVSIPWRLAGERSQYFQYGFGKFVQAGTLLVALGAILAGFWLAGQAFDQTVLGFDETTPLRLAISATTSALVACWHGFLCYAHVDHSDRAKRVLLRPRLRLFAMSVLVQVFLTISVLAKDPELAFWFDIAGAAAVSMFIVVGSLRLAWECICDLIDRPLGKEREKVIVAVLYREGVQPEELADLRTRCCGRQIFAELTLCVSQAMPIEEARHRLASLRGALETAVQDLDLVIKLRGSQP